MTASTVEHWYYDGALVLCWGPLTQPLSNHSSHGQRTQWLSMQQEYNKLAKSRKYL